MTDLSLEKGLKILDPIRTVRVPEHADQYEAILHGLIGDLDSPDTLSVLLCEQVAEAVYWLRRHIDDKEMILYEAIAEEIDKTLGHRTFPNTKSMISVDEVTAIYTRDDPFKDEVVKALKKAGNKTLADCRARAFVLRSKELKLADDLIQRQRLSLGHLQKSLDSIDMKKRLIKRMDLEIAQMEKDLAAIEHESKTN